MTGRGDALATLDSLVEIYKADVTAYYINAYKNSKGNKSVPKFSFTALSKKIFDGVATNELPSLYIQLFDLCDEWARFKGIRYTGNPEFNQSLLSLQELILNIILPYQLPQSNKRKVVEKDGKKKTSVAQVQPRCAINLDQAKIIFSRFLPIVLPYPNEAKIWKQMKYILMRCLRPDDGIQLSLIVLQHMEKGDISFSALSYLMADDKINQKLGPDTIIYAFYIGPVKAQTIELFASNRTPEFRKKCREVIVTVEKARRNNNSYRQFCPNNIWKNVLDLWNFGSFSSHSAQVIGELKGIKSSHPLIFHSWAYSAIKKFGKKTYVDKTYSMECYYDLIWTILAQRPNMKRFVLETLERDFQDQEAVRFWRKMNPSQMSRHQIKQPSVKEIDVLRDHSDEFLNFPTSVEEVCMISNTAELAVLKDAIVSEVLEHKRALIALDAEWSAFNGDSKATILQVAVKNKIFIVDIESKTMRHDELREFFTFMFRREDIIKLGFQFGEDLYQMRNAITNCRALYQPEKVVCIGKIISELLEITEKRSDKEEILLKYCPNFLNNDKQEDVEEPQEEINADESMEVEETVANTSTSSEPQQPEAINVLNKGLSYLCDQILGRPLDKMEQCSVWDRRPLRPLQIRYAAMDAYCLLMIYEVASKWALAVGTTIDDLINKQKPPRSSLPLFSDEC